MSHRIRPRCAILALAACLVPAGTFAQVGLHFPCIGSTGGTVSGADFTLGVINGSYAATMNCSSGFTQVCKYCFFQGFTFDDPKYGWVYCGTPTRTDFGVGCSENDAVNEGLTRSGAVTGLYAYIVTTYTTSCSSTSPHVDKNFRAQFQVSNP